MSNQTSATDSPTGAVPAEIDLAALLERRARISGERPAVTFLGITQTLTRTASSSLRTESKT